MDKKYFDIDLSIALVSAAAGVVAGYMSFLINQPVMGFLLAAGIMALLFFVLKTSMKIENDNKWWLGNSVVIFALSWFVVWTVFYNIALYSTLP